MQMDNKYYLDMMSQYNDEELTQIINSKTSNKKSIEAGKQILAQRGSTKNKITSLDNEKLLSAFADKTKKIPDSEARTFIKEFRKRGLDPKMWFIRNNKKEEGPFTAKDMMGHTKSGRINYYNTWVWRKGMSEWRPAYEIQGLFDKEDIPKKAGTLIAASFLIIISAFLWFMISFLQFLYGKGSIIGFIAAMNFIMSFVLLAIGVGVMYRKPWAYKWGMMGSVGTAIYNGIVVIVSLNLLLTVIPVLEILIIVLLYRGRHYIVKAPSADFGFIS
jgi:hypothetical protein